MSLYDSIYWFLRKKYVNWAMYHDPRRLANILYRDVFHRWINWKNPQDLNEKINWLAFYTDTSLWTVCADKYAVRDYVKSKGLEHILVPLYGKWDRPEDINFENLPEKFVLKPNNGNSDLIVVKDKNKLDVGGVISKLRHSGASKFIASAQPHYLYIRPCFIAEKLLETDCSLGLVDYKVYVFNGRPYCIWTWANRKPLTHTGDCGVYDIDWKPQFQWIRDQSKKHSVIPKPQHLDKMLEYAKILGADFEQVRVDFYEVDGKVYFGELTFTSAAGRDFDFTDEALLELGRKIKLDFSKKIRKHYNLSKFKYYLIE